MTDLLDGVRARAALVVRAALEPGWSVRFAGGAYLTMVSPLRGRAWVGSAEETAVVDPGDVAVLRGPAPFTVGEHPAVGPPRVITRDDYCDRARDAAAPPRTCGDPNGATVLLSGAYEARSGVGDGLLATLPTLLVVRGADPAVLAQVAAEVAPDRPGQQALLDRLLDLALISTLRTWFATEGTATTADPLVATAVRLLGADIAHPWTVAALATAAGTSRAVLARRFTAEVGQTPMAHLADLRLARAADLLRDTSATVAAIARQVGYANAFALSAAFKRRRGFSPSALRGAGGVPVANGVEAT
ncbi:AraC family transcriptional regulator [Actinokineospora diospyrosa]